VCPSNRKGARALPHEAASGEQSEDERSALPQRITARSPTEPSPFSARPMHGAWGIFGVTDGADIG